MNCNTKASLDEHIAEGDRISFVHKGKRRRGKVLSLSNGWAVVEGEPEGDWKHGDPSRRPVVRFNIDHPERDALKEYKMEEGAMKLTAEERAILVEARRIKSRLNEMAD